MISRRSFLTAALAASTTACGPLRGAALFFPGSLELRGSTTVPFKLAGNHIYIVAGIGKQPYSFIFDTGGAAILTPQTQAALKFPVVGSVNVAGLDDAGKESDLVRVPVASIGGATYSKGAFIVIALPFLTANPFPALPFGGILGREFFTKLVTVVDYERSLLTFYEPSIFRPDPSAVTLALAMRDGNPNVTASIDGRAGSFDVDTGAAQGLVLTRSFAESSGIERSFHRTVEAVIGHGTGGISIGTQARAKIFELGSIELRDPIAGIPRADAGALASPGLAGNIGAGILHRFTVTLDVPHGHLYLRPNAHLGDPFEYNRAGVFTERDAGGAENVAFVAPQSPASEAGIAAGDAIASVDGRAAGRLSHDQIAAFWEARAGTKVGIGLLREGRPVARTIVLRDSL